MLVIGGKLAVAAPLPPQPAPQEFPPLSWVLETARKRAPDVVSQQGALRVAEATMVGARLIQLGNPYLEVFADRRSSGGAGLNLQANLWLPLDLSGQRGRRVSESEALTSWQRTGLQASVAIAEGKALATYGAIMVAMERARFLSALVRAAKDEASYYEGRFEHGDATVREAKLAAVEVVRNTVALEEVRADLTRALTELATLLGVPRLPDPTGALQSPPSQVWADVEATAAELAAKSPAVLAAAQEADYFHAVRRRQAVEAHAPVNFILSAGRGEMGDALIGGGLSWTFPALRRNQGEQAQATAQQNRALAERQVNEVRTYATLRGIAEEHTEVQKALHDIQQNGEPAAQAALDASIALHRAGKGDLLFILSARRDLALMNASALLLVLREWNLLADFVALTGKTPQP
ncbi:MAG: TolC family protein [Deltaproteobacteria bacterium]|nr:TolC family protein [Deltaproteobacteria bacterium]